jgi:hypothetical protein
VFPPAANMEYMVRGILFSFKVWVRKL